MILIVVLAAAAIAYVALSVGPLGLGDGASESHLISESTEGEFSDNGLRTANRDHYAICVDTYGAEPSMPQDTHAVFAAALADASQDPTWVRSVGEEPPTADFGCPPPAVFDPAATRIQTGQGIDVMDVTLTTEAGQYKGIFYVTAAATIRDMFGDFPPIASQEVLRQSYDHLIQVTYAIFVSPEDLTNATYIRALILINAGVMTPSSLYGPGGKLINR